MTGADPKGNMKTMTIEDHWDPGAVITAKSDPATEFAIWKEHADAGRDGWRGDEFTLEDFEHYIARLKEI